MENKEASNASVTSQLISQLQPISNYWLSRDLTPQSDLIVFWDAYRLHRNLFVHTQLQFWQSNDSYDDELFASCILLFTEMGDALDKIKAAILIYASVYQRTLLKQFK